MASQPAPGWYDDGTGKHRWWDGARWTEEHIDLREERTELHRGAAPTGTGAAPAGWYDDRRGRQRWWDGREWTSSVRYSGQEQVFAGIVLDGRWIHFGDRSQPVGDVEVALVTRGGGLHLVVSGPQTWVVPVPAGAQSEARQFVSWVQASARHYRYS